MPALQSPPSQLLAPPSLDLSISQSVNQSIETHAYSLGQIVYQTQGPILGVYLINQSTNQSICVASRTSLTLLSTRDFHELQSINQSILPSPINCCFYAINNQSINQSVNPSANPIIIGHEDGSISLIDPINQSIKVNKKCHDTAVSHITTTNQSINQSINQYIYSVDSTRTRLIVSSIKTLEMIDEYVEMIGLIDCLIAESGIVWIGLSNGLVKRLTLPARAITHIVKPADIPIRQPVNQLINQSVNTSSNQSVNQSINQSINYGPIRCLYASQSPPPVTKKAKKKKGEIDESINQSINQTDDPTIIVWSSHGFASLTAWDTRSINQSTNQSINQSTILHQQRLTFDAIASVQHSYNQLQINQSINQSMKPFSPSNQPSTRSNAQSLLTQPQSINQSSNQIINCMLVHDGVLYTGQEDGMIGVINLSNNQSINQSTNPLSPTSKQPINQPVNQSISRRQLVEVDAQGNDSIHHMIIVTSNEDQSINQSINESLDQSDKDSSTEEKTNNDSDDEDNQSIDPPQPVISQEPLKDSINQSIKQSINQLVNPLCPAPYIVFGTRAGQLHVVPLTSLSDAVTSQTHAMAELEGQMRDDWAAAKAVKASKSTRNEKKKK